MFIYLEKAFPLEINESLFSGSQKETDAFVADVCVNVEEIAESDAGDIGLIATWRTILINYIAQLQNFSKNVRVSLATAYVGKRSRGWPET